MICHSNDLFSFNCIRTESALLNAHVQIGGHALHRLEAPFSQQIRAYTHTMGTQRACASAAAFKTLSAAAENKAAPRVHNECTPSASRPRTNGTTMRTKQ